MHHVPAGQVLMNFLSYTVVEIHLIEKVSRNYRRKDTKIKRCTRFRKRVQMEWMDDMQFYVLFNSIAVISERWEVDNERLCAMELQLRFRRFRLELGSNSVR